MSNLPKCEYCGKFVNPNKSNIKKGIRYGCMSVDYDYYYHAKCKQKTIGRLYKILTDYTKEVSNDR